jgi:hypothetical protein
MHGIQSEAIEKAFNEAASLLHDEAFSGDEDDFYNLFDFFYDTESWIQPDSVEAAFCVGQKNPTAKRYSVWWGSAIGWFIGDEQAIVRKLKRFTSKHKKDDV